MHNLAETTDERDARMSAPNCLPDSNPTPRHARTTLDYAQLTHTYCFLSCCAQ